MVTNLQCTITGIPGSEDCRTDSETCIKILPAVADFQHKRVLFRVFSSVESGSTAVDIGFPVPIWARVVNEFSVASGCTQPLN